MALPPEMIGLSDPRLSRNKHRTPARGLYSWVCISVIEFRINLEMCDIRHEIKCLFRCLVRKRTRTFARQPYYRSRRFDHDEQKKWERLTIATGY